MVSILEADRMISLSPCKPDMRHGKAPFERTVPELLKSGVVFLDKPRGPTSHQTAAWVRDVLGVEKAGHHGTLDPNTTGVLPIAVGSGLRLLDSTLSEGKEYIALMGLHKEIDDRKLSQVLKEFTGEIYQMVPVRAAVRRGLRTRKVHQIKLIERDGRDVLISVGCESGTYIRTLINDIGEVLGVGANMKELRRSRSGSATEDITVTLQQLSDAMVLYKENGNEEHIRKALMPCELLVSHMKKLVVKDTAVDALCHGAPLGIPGLSSVEDGIRKGDTIAMMSLKQELIALGEALSDYSTMIKASSGMAAKTTRVIMEPSTYPKGWKTKEVA